MASTITVTFSGRSGAEVRKGPFPVLRLESEVLVDPGGTVIGRHQDHHWEVDGVAYTRLECDCNDGFNVHFERGHDARSKIYGPLQSFSFVDGIAYMNRQVFAFADRSIVDWYCHEDGQHWPVMVIEPIQVT